MTPKPPLHTQPPLMLAPLTHNRAPLAKTAPFTRPPPPQAHTVLPARTLCFARILHPPAPSPSPHPCSRRCPRLCQQPSKYRHGPPPMARTPHPRRARTPLGLARAPRGFGTHLRPPSCARQSKVCKDRAHVLGVRQPSCEGHGKAHARTEL